MKPSAVRATVAVAAAALVLSACGSGDGDEGLSAGNTTDGTASSDKCNTDADAAVAEALKSGSGDPLPTEKVDGALAKGKTLWLVLLSAQIPALADQGKGFQAAAEAVGAKARVFDAKGTPDGAAQAVNTAIAAKADGIVLSSIDPAVIKGPLADAKAAGIPVVDGFTGDPEEELVEGVLGHATPNNVEVGRIQARYAASVTDCKIKALTVASLGAKPSAASTRGVQEELGKLCSDDCKTTVVDINPVDIPTKLVGLVQTNLQRNPDVNIITAASDTYVPYIVQALKAIKLDIGVIGGSGTAIAVGQTGGPMVANVVYPPTVSVGWYYFHAMLQALSGKTDFALEFPTALVDKSNWGTSPDPLDLQPRFQGYEKKFATLWGAS